MFGRNSSRNSSSAGGVNSILAVGLVFGVLASGVILFSSSSEQFRSYISGSLLAFGGQNEGIDVNQYNFGCKPGGTYSDAVWCSAYGSTYEGNVAAAQLHQDKVVLFKGSDTLGDYYKTGDLVATGVFGANGLSPSSVVHCPPGASVSAVHTSSHTKNSPNINMMFDGNSHYWCEQGGVAVSAVAGMEPGRALFPDVSWWSNREALTLEVSGGVNYYKNTSNNYRLCGGVIQGPYPDGYYYCVNSLYSQYLATTAGTAPAPALSWAFVSSGNSSPYTNSSSVTAGPGARIFAAVTFTNNGTNNEALTLSASGSSPLTDCKFHTQGRQDLSVINYTQGAGSLTLEFSCDISGVTSAGTHTITGTAVTDSGITLPSLTYTQTVTVSSTSTAGWAPGTPANVAPTSYTVDSGAAFTFQGTAIVTGTPPQGSSVTLEVYLNESAYTLENVGGSSYHYLYSGSANFSPTLSSSLVTVPFPAGVIDDGTYFWRARLITSDGQTGPWNWWTTSFTVGSGSDSGSTTPDASWSLSAPGNLYVADGSRTNFTSDEVVQFYATFQDPSNLVPSSYQNASFIREIEFATSSSFEPSSIVWTNQTSGSKPSNGNNAGSVWSGNASPQSIVKGTPLYWRIKHIYGDQQSPWTISWTPITFYAVGTDLSTLANATTATPAPTSAPSTVTTTPSGNTSSATTGTVVTVPTAMPLPAGMPCPAGQRCNESAWCDNGERCYYNNGDFTCAAWGAGCPSDTSLCGPNEGEGCTKPGETVTYTSNAWCRGSMSCYSDTQMTCVPTPYMDPVAMAVPSAGMYEQPECPNGFSFCRPDDDGCTKPGETNSSSSAWCSRSQTCHLSGGGIYCPKDDNEECPSGSGVCRDGDTNCVGQNKKGSLDGWCGGSAVQCFGETDLYCAAVNGNDPMAWEAAQCPNGYSRCRDTDLYCLERGETCSFDAPKASLRDSALGSLLGFSPLPTSPTNYSQCWCTNGNMQQQSDKTWKCVAWDQAPAVPAPVACLKVVTLATDGSKCEEFSSSCLPEGWTELAADQTCEKGVVVRLSSTDRLEDLKRKRDELLLSLKDYDLRVKQLPVYAKGVKEIEASLKEAITLLKSLKISAADNLDTIDDQLRAVRRDALSNIGDRIAGMKPFFEWAKMSGELSKRLEELKAELRRVSRTSEYFQLLSDHISALEKMIESAGTKTVAREMSSVLDLIRNELSAFSTIVDGRRGEQREEFLAESLIDLQSSLADLREQVESAGIVVRAEIQLIRLEEMVATAQAAADRGSFPAALDIVNKAYKVRDQLYIALGEERNGGFEDILDRVLSEKFGDLTATMVAFADQMSQKLEVMMDEAFQNIVGVVARIEKDLSDRVEQSVARLASVSQEVRNEMVVQKSEILQQVEVLNARLSDAKLQSSLASRVEKLIEEMTYYNWCGSYGEEVASRMQLMTLAIESGELTRDDVTSLEKRVAALAEKNTSRCFEIGATKFKDVATEQWYFDGSQFCGTSSVNNQILIQGYADEGGNLLGEFGPANTTLRIEALTMFVRLAGHVAANNTPADASALGVPDWGWKYYNAATGAGIVLPKYDWSLPITRIESADLLMRFFGDLIPKVAVGAKVKAFADYSQFSGHADIEDVAATNAVGIFKGSSDGNFYPYNNFLRSEYGAVVQRAVENLGLQVDEPQPPSGG
jgi:hypothetical protein